MSTPNQPAFLKLDSIEIAYDAKPVVHDVSFELAEGELGCLLGPSGCGKTTILKAISGFEQLKNGKISLNNRLLSDPKVSIAPEQRQVGMVFQDHALFPHISIFQNVAFGLKREPKIEQRKRAQAMLELVGMTDYANAYPHEISGGQSQRIALARALAPSPTLLLLDEPFSNLDASLRESLGYEVRSVLKQAGTTAIMVTHDQHDAFALGDKIGVMSDGNLLQWGTSYQLYHEPINRFVAGFIGDGVLICGQMSEPELVTTKLGDIRGKTNNEELVGKNVDLLLRPDDVVLDSDSTEQARIVRKAFKGAQTLYTLKTQSGVKLLSLLPSHEDFEIGDKIGIRIDADHLVCFPLVGN